MEETQLIAKLYERVEVLTGDSDKKRKSLELLKCLQIYRTCPSIATLLKHKPQLVYQLDEIYKLWKQFDKMPPKELSDLATQLIDDVCNQS